MLMNSAEEFWQKVVKEACVLWKLAEWHSHSTVCWSHLQWSSSWLHEHWRLSQNVGNKLPFSADKIPEECRFHEKFIFYATDVIILVAIRLLQLCLDGVVWHGVNLQMLPKWVVPIIRSRTVHISVLSKNGLRAVNPAHIWLGYISY